MGRHRIVAAYLDRTEPFLALIQRLPPPETPVERALHAVFDYQLGQGSLDRILEVLRAAPLQGVDPELLVLFANNYATAADVAGSVQEAKPVVRRARALLAKDSPVELQCAVLNAESLLARAEGNVARQVALLGEVVARYGSASPKRTGALMNLAFYLALIGRVDEIDAELDELREGLEPRGRARVDFFRFIHTLEAGDTARATALHDEIALQRASLVGYEPELRTYEALLMVQAALAGRRDVTASDDEPWVGVVAALAARRPLDALEQARRHAAANLDESLSAVGFPAYSLVRAELACGNGDAAERLLTMRRSRGNGHAVDDLFGARIELLAGRPERAAVQFRRALASLERAGAKGRVDLELRLACELSPADLLQLGRAVERTPGAKRPSPARKDGPSGGAPPEPRSGERMIGPSAHLTAVRAQIARFGPLDVPVLITGETGTGKELVAQALHEAGPRSREPFVAVNCAAIPETLLESELFGYSRGAFTGASRRHAGLFEQAGKGTLFLDEIGDIPARLQAALLRVLESGDYRPVGANRTRTARCRVVAATNAPLSQMADDDRFRADLLYRLRRLEIVIEPLRARPDDVLAIAEHLLSTGRRDGQRPTFSIDLQRALREHRWPGNVRELRNVIERMRIMSSEALAYDADAFRAACEDSGPSAASPTPARGPGLAATPRDDVATLLAQGSSPLRRRERLRGLFRDHDQLTRVEIVRILEISKGTATRDLAALIDEGFVRKVTPTASPRTHYFERSQGSG